MEALNKNEQVTACHVEEGDFKDWDKLLDCFYKWFAPGTVFKSHIFSVADDNSALMFVKRSNLELLSEQGTTR
eukprot:3069131-Ditylum_brightwellii.AAC.1